MNEQVEQVPPLPVSEIFIPQSQLLQLDPSLEINGLSKLEILNENPEVFSSLRELLKLADDISTKKAIARLNGVYRQLLKEEDNYLPFLQEAFDETCRRHAARAPQGYPLRLWTYPTRPLTFKSTVLNSHHLQANSNLCQLPSEILHTIFQLLDEQLDEVKYAILATYGDDFYDDGPFENFSETASRISNSMMLWDHTHRVGAGALALTCKLLAQFAIQARVSKRPGLTALMEWDRYIRQEWRKSVKSSSDRTTSCDLQDSDDESSTFEDQGDAANVQCDCPGIDFCSSCFEWRPACANYWQEHHRLIHKWSGLGENPEAYADMCIESWPTNCTVDPVWSRQSQELIEDSSACCKAAICPTCRAHWLWVRDSTQRKLQRNKRARVQMKKYATILRKMIKAEALFMEHATPEVVAE